MGALRFVDDAGRYLDDEHPAPAFAPRPKRLARMARMARLTE
jgi:hypothetical protein